MESPTERKTGMSTTRVSVTPAGKLRPRHVKNDATVIRDDYTPGEFVEWDVMRDILRRDLEPAERTAGKHFALLAPTRGGKTTVTTEGLLPIYRAADVPVLVVDSTADPKLAKYGERLPRIGKFTELHRVTITDMGYDSIMRVYNAIQKAYKQGDMVIYVDEIRHVADPKFMGLGKMLENIWLFGGKHGITLGGASQAPRWLPSAFYDQSQAHLLFRIRDIRSRKRVGEISGDTETLGRLIPELPRYHFAYVSPDGDVLTSKYKLKGAHA